MVARGTSATTGTACIMDRAPEEAHGAVAPRRGASICQSHSFPAPAAGVPSFVGTVSGGMRSYLAQTNRLISFGPSGTEKTRWRAEQ